jgi:hypothetical protein
MTRTVAKWRALLCQRRAKPPIDCGRAHLRIWRDVKRQLVSGLVTTLLAVGAPALADRPVAWIAVGGGSDPVSNEVSLEQDIELARRVFGKDGVVLFAGGRDAVDVRVDRPGPAGDDLLAALGEIFDPRDGRSAGYRRTVLKPHGPATSDAVATAISKALGNDREPLLIYLATHGDRGDTDRNNLIRLWGGFPFTVADLAKLLDAAAAPRRVRLVVTACYSGGFAELAFAEADVAKGAAVSDRCGLFATTADEMASGCDPNPDRRVQQGYGRYFLHALRGEDETGKRLPMDEIDFDGDGRVSLLEAHTRVRIVLTSLDIPTSTSERWLRASGPREGPESDVSLVEEDAVVARLGARLFVADEDAARGRLEAAEKALGAADEELKHVESEYDAKASELQTALLERWPVLDDPWHPDFRKTLRQHRLQVERFLDQSPLASQYWRLQRELDDRGEPYDELKLKTAMLRRLVRAYETRSLARRLRAAGGEAWERYERFLQCERSGLELP